MWMASSLALAGCGEPGGTEASQPAEPSAAESLRLELKAPADEGLDTQRRIIVYSLTSGELYAVDRRGTTRLLARRTGKPVVSPNGRQVAYSKLPDTWSAGDPVVRADLHVFDTRSGNIDRLTQGYDDTEPVWTPDGHSLLFQSSRRSGMPSLWKVRENGHFLAQVTNEDGGQGELGYVPNPASSDTVKWGPTERRIIVYSSAPTQTNGDVRVIAFNRALDMRATYSLGEGHSPRWTEQGTVVFARNEGDKVISIEVSVD